MYDASEFLLCLSSTRACRGTNVAKGEKNSEGARKPFFPAHCRSAGRQMHTRLAVIDRLHFNSVSLSTRIGGGCSWNDQRRLLRLRGSGCCASSERRASAELEP